MKEGLVMQYQHILVPVDGSKQAYSALQKAIFLAKQFQAEIIIAHIIDTRSYQNLISYDRALIQQAHDEASQLVSDYEKEVKKAGLACQTYVSYGCPRQELCYDLPEKYDIDLIMMGATGLNSLERLVLGSISEYLSHHAPCDVMIVRTNKAMEKIDEVRP